MKKLEKPNKIDWKKVLKKLTPKELKELYGVP